MSNSETVVPGAKLSIKNTSPTCKTVGKRNAGIITGFGFTMMRKESVFMQPQESVKLTVYVVVTGGDALGFEHESQLKPVEGLQTKEVAPVA